MDQFFHFISFIFEFLIIITGIQLSFFLISYIFKTDKLFDFAGSINFFLISFIGLYQNGIYDYPRQAILSIFQMIWSLRLCSFLLIRIIERKGDSRLDKFKGNFLQFLILWMFQILWIWLVSFPIILIIANNQILRIESRGIKETEMSIGIIDYIGWCLWSIGFIIESMADHTKYIHQRQASKERLNENVKIDKRNNNFKSISSNFHSHSFLVKSGLWSWSRHPNYFGEILLWIGVSISTFNGLWNISIPFAILTLISPLWTIILLCFISGIPISENNYMKKYHEINSKFNCENSNRNYCSDRGGKRTYIDYLENTSILILVPPSFYGKFPIWVKRNIFMDRWYPQYHCNFEEKELKGQ